VTESEFIVAFWLFVWLAPPVLVAWAAYLVLTLPMRRHERARFFLDLLEQGLRDGQAPEQIIVAVSQSRDPAMGARFHLLAAYLETGRRLGEGLEKVPRLLPPQISAMLRAGEQIGDVGVVLPACRQLAKDGLSHTRGALNYLPIFALVLFPLAPAILLTLAKFVLPRLMVVFAEMGVPTPPVAAYVLNHANTLAGMMLLAALLVNAVTFAFLGGPRLSAWMQFDSFPLWDWVLYQLPWRRKRMFRDFGAMLSALLDAGVPEPRAVKLAAACTANLIFLRRAERIVDDLRTGRRLSEAMRRLEETGEFRWRLANAAQAANGFRAALSGWIEALDAKAFQQQQAAAHAATTALVLLNGLLVGALVVATFQSLIAIVNAGLLW
jgi:type II secretory pathway component PulF